MTTVESMAIQVYSTCTKLSEELDCWKAVDLCDQLLSEIAELKREAMSLQQHCEKACENGE